MITLTLEEIEMMLLGDTVYKDDVSINVSRETVDFYKGEKQLEERFQDECF